ncbi:MAG: RNA polymerase sigma factor [Candidatus Kapaibacterium sp.]|nr:RNA polymerase sigma factor [Ignavibacteria bacterium]
MSNSYDTAQLTDEDLMGQFQEGNEKAFVELYDRYNRRLYGYCVKMLNDKVLAEDLFQEIFIRVSRKRDHFRGGNFSGWLFAIARNQCLNALRDNVTHTSLDDVSGMLTAPDLELYDETSELLKEAIEKLPDEMKEALILRVYSGFSYQEIAEITGAKLATVKVRIHRAKIRLHDLLTPFFAEHYSKQNSTI